MPIEFYCPHCEAYLRAPDLKAGLSIRCPHCTNRLWVPLESEPEQIDFDDDEASNELEPAEQSLSSNTSRASSAFTECFQCGTELTENLKICWNCGFLNQSQIITEPDEVDLGEILSTTWRIFTQHFWACLVVTASDLFLTAIVTIITFIVGGLAAITVVANQPGLGVIAFFVVAGLGWSLAVATLAIGHMKFYLDLCRNDVPDLGKTVNFQGPVRQLWMGGIIFWVSFWMVLPAMFLWPFGRVMVDKNCSFTQGMWRTLKLTVKNAGVCCVLFVIKAAALLLSGSLPVVGTILLTPYVATLNTVAYLYMIGEME